MLRLRRPGNNSSRFFSLLLISFGFLFPGKAVRHFLDFIWEVCKAWSEDISRKFTKKYWIACRENGWQFWLSKLIMCHGHPFNSFEVEGYCLPVEYERATTLILEKTLLYRVWRLGANPKDETNFILMFPLTANIVIFPITYMPLSTMFYFHTQSSQSRQISNMCHFVCYLYFDSNFSKLSPTTNNLIQA